MNTQKHTKTPQRVIVEVQSWMQEEEKLERQQSKADEQWRDNQDHEVPKWLWPEDSDPQPSDMVYH